MMVERDLEKQPFLSQKRRKDAECNSYQPGRHFARFGFAERRALHATCICIALCGLFSTWILLSSPASLHAPLGKAPAAKRIRETIVLHDVEVCDDFGWMRLLDVDPDVRRYIDEETAFTDSIMKPTLPLQQKITRELEEAHANVQKLKLQLSSVVNDGCRELPVGVTSFWEDGSYLYMIDTQRTYPVYVRRQIFDDADNSMIKCNCLPAGIDEVVLDYNLLHLEAPFFQPGVFEVNRDDESIIAFSYDTIGQENFALFVRNATGGHTLGMIHGINETYYSARWKTIATPGNKQHWLYYNVVDRKWGVPRHVYKTCVVGCSDPTPQLVYSEDDPSLTTEVDMTSDGKLVYINISGQVTTEVRLITDSAAHPERRALFLRVKGIRYRIEHVHGYLYILTNAGGAVNYQIIRLVADCVMLLEPPPDIEAVTSGRTRCSVETIVPHSDDIFIERMEMFAEKLIYWFRQNGLRKFALINLSSGAIQLIEQLGDTYSIYPSTVNDMEARLYRRFTSNCFTFSNSSFLEPPRTYVLHLDNGDIYPLNDLPENNDWKVDLEMRYEQKRVWVPSSTTPETMIPVSLFYPVGEMQDQPRPLLLSAYGAYGGFQDPYFDPDLLPLVNRGIVYAICHPRGDADMGAAWYTSAKYETKNQTFADVEDCLTGLIDLNITRAGSIAVVGRSAGGLCVGDVISRLGWVKKGDSSEGYVKVAVAHVPFVDPVHDMIDPTVAWTAYEWYEWGNPQESKAILDAMLAYSPYENVPPVERLPAVFVTGGLADPRVGYYEPLKYVAKLRTRGAHADVLIRIHNNGHFGGSSDDDSWRQLAEWYAFVITALNAEKYDE
ncbi:prolyl oligopeptidase family-domain-containing protein [Gaertneriomyces semiglobifer]|nr:prolyl oligopeptidase family-domain-containing protein [Gaertneriomyces semiglobifer]